jgi:hypothetical protein
MLTNKDVVAQGGNAVIAEINGEIVALDAAKGTCYGMNKIATRVWNLIAAPRPIREICDVLLDEYEIDAPTCEKQVLELLEDLDKEGLLEVSAAPNAPAGNEQ